LELNGKTYGIPVEGTELLRHGNAPRRSTSDRNQMAWYECTRCGEFKSIRAQSVRPGTTVTCGCKGRRQFIEHFEQRAANLPIATQKRIFELARHRSPRKRLSPWELANKFKLTKYVIDFVIAARCAALRAIAEVGNIVMNALSRREFDWVRRFQLWKEECARSDDRNAFLAGLHWRDREAYLAAELKAMSVSTAVDIHPLLQDPEADVEWGWHPLPFPVLSEARR
jgi:hypothetical protein